MPRYSTIALGAGAIALAGSISLAQTPPPEIAGQQVYDRTCGACHNGGDETAPELARLRTLGAERISRAIHAGGLMATQASGLTEDQRAIQAVAERYPEICAAEHRFLERVLAAKVDRTAHILGGCAACEYHVQLDSDVPAGDVVQIKPRDARPGVNA